ncbi:MAG: DEAD/DEAH box helicase, partial [Patescibacteria group bacterium]
MQEFYNTLIRTPISVLSASARQTQSLAERLKVMSEQTRAPDTWVAVTDSLTPPEQAGVISTMLTRGFHSLLARNPHIHLLVPRQTSETAVFPDPRAYGKLTFHFTVDQRRERTEFIEALVRAGYTRHQKTIESGGIRVRGEAVDVSHPAFPGPITITFHGNVVESITEQQERRRVALSRLSLPPMKFPETHLPFEKFTETFPWQSVAIPPFLVPETSAVASPVSRDRALELLGNLQEGKPAVHADHGIGVYEGLHLKRIDTIEREYLVLQYAQGDTLYVPVDFAHKVSAYVGEGIPHLHRLGGTVWAKTRQRAKEEAAAFAKELIAIAGKRRLSQRPPYQISPTVEAALARSFPFDLTPGQTHTWKEVKRDLTNTRPADRVIVGDVGFGKTEIAIRAARHIVESGKQVALLAPTTLLVQQHLDTFRARLPELTHRIGMLSRFTSAAAAAALKSAIKAHTVSIAIGTHALLGPRVEWQNLGLVIIDEEQKFGVRQKEHFKKLRSTVDIISLSATPIPRTLAFALSGLRDLSLIHTAPAGRRSVITRVSQRSDSVVQQALTRELERAGQIYVVASKIKHLAALREHVVALAPRLPAGRQARIGLAHGRLPEKTLA